MKTLHHAFTQANEGLVNVLRTEITIVDPFNDVKHGIYNGIWDTGATHTAISKRLIEELQLTPTGKAEVYGVHGRAEVFTYLVSAILPNGLTVNPLSVSEFQGLHDCDVLIGMDIIALGDFVICNHGGKTLFSFSIPPHEKKYDLVQRANQLNKKSYNADK